MAKYTIEKMTIREACDVALPAVQQVRGKVWTAEAQAALVKTYKAGGYIPPIAMASLPSDEPDKARRHINTDGQQRLFALSIAAEKGLVSWDDLIAVAIEDCETEDEAIAMFHRLNSGVPVGGAIVAASGLNSGARDAVLALAGHAYIQTYFDKTAQARRTGRACDIAMSVLAIAAGWESPDSMSKTAAAWIASDEGGAKLTDEDWNKALAKADDALTALGSAAKRYADALDAMPKKDEACKTAKAILSCCRRKNMTLTAVNAIMDEDTDEEKLYRAGQTLALYGNPAILEKPVTIEGTGPKGGKVKVTYHWTIGRGSSGSASEFRDRDIIIHAHDGDPDLCLTAGLVPVGNATMSAGERGIKKAASDAVDAVAAAFGV